MKFLRFLIDLPIRSIFALFGFTLGGWIGWLGIILVSLRFFGVIHWPWWLAALPLEYGVLDDQGNDLDSASVGLGLLLGDVNADRVVNRLDTNEAQMHKGQKAVQQNFRNDVKADGHIEKSDIELIRQQQGTSLP